MTKHQHLPLVGMVIIALGLAAASVSPLALDISATGIITFHTLAIEAIAPAILVWIASYAASKAAGLAEIAGAFRVAIPAGILGTIALEIIRVIGFRGFAAMPGSMPMLMGVLMTDRFMQGPDLLSNLLGWGDHILVNGVGFAFIYVTMLGRQKWFVGTLFGLVVGTIFMLGPMMDIIGAGKFGQDYAPIAFPLTVYLAHICFGSTIGVITQNAASTPERSLFLAAVLSGLRIVGIGTPSQAHTRT
ncbi:MAG: hypothetical protein KGK13_06930 [Rhodospirillales bacterium]|nr:hypothetical protein [Rhodospirillales bacterium]